VYLLHKSRPSRPLALLVPAAAATILAVGCRDITNPSIVPIESVRASYVPNYALETPETTMTVPSYAGTGMLPTASAPGITVAHYTAVELTFYSSVTGTSSNGSTTSFGVRGQHCPYSTHGSLAFGSNGGGVLNLCVFAPAGQQQLATTVVDTTGIQGSVGLDRRSHSSTMTWSASPATVTIRPIPVELKVQGLNHLGSTVVHLDESTILLTGSAVQLELRSDPEIVKVRTGLWLQTGGVQFQPDSGPAITCNPTLNVSGTRRARCPLSGITRSGTLTVTALANGKWQTKELRIIRNQDFILTPDPPSAFVDDSITFTATVNGIQVPVASWRWQGPVAADTTHDCIAGDVSCKQKLVFIGQGRMTAFLANNDSAGATVTAQDTIPCPTGDDGSPEYRSDRRLTVPEAAEAARRTGDAEIEVHG
jgi:hypothetical protein